MFFTAEDVEIAPGGLCALRGGGFYSGRGEVEKMDMASHMCDSDRDMLNLVKTSNHDPSSSQASFPPMGGLGAEK